MTALPVNSDRFQEEVLNHKGVVMVDFYAEWCGPCKLTEPIIDGLSNDMKNVKFVKIDVDKNPDLASSYSVFSIPTFVVFNNGKIASQLVGAVGKERFVQELEKIATP